MGSSGLLKPGLTARLGGCCEPFRPRWGRVTSTAQFPCLKNGVKYGPSSLPEWPAAHCELATRGHSVSGLWPCWMHSWTEPSRSSGTTGWEPPAGLQGWGGGLCCCSSAWGPGGFCEQRVQWTQVRSSERWSAWAGGRVPGQETVVTERVSARPDPGLGAPPGRWFSMQIVGCTSRHSQLSISGGQDSGICF